MIYKLTPEEKSTAKKLVTEFVGEVLRRNSNGNSDLETGGIYNLLGNYVDGFYDEEMVYREITAQFKNHATTLIGANRARTKRLQEKAPYILAASFIPLLVPPIAPLAFMAFIMGSTVLIEKDKREKFQIREAIERYNLVEFLGCRQGARAVRNLKSIIEGG